MSQLLRVRVFVEDQGYVSHSHMLAPQPLVALVLGLLPSSEDRGH